MGELVATKEQYAFFKSLYDEESERAKILAEHAKNNLGLATLYSAFILFVVEKQVEWRYCILAMIVCAIGGYSSATMSRRIPQPVLRGLVVVIGLTMAAWFFWTNP